MYRCTATHKGHSLERTDLALGILLRVKGSKAMIITQELRSELFGDHEDPGDKESQLVLSEKAVLLILGATVL